VLPQHPSVIAIAQFSQTGTLRSNTQTDRWFEFEATHLVVPPAIGFVWNAKVRIAPLLHVRVMDALVNGSGSGQATLMSKIAIHSAAGTPEMNSGSLHRFLAGAVWYPTALLPSNDLHWTPIDGCRALATLSDGQSSVELEFRFADTGKVTAIYTPARWGHSDAITSRCHGRAIFDLTGGTTACLFPQKERSAGIWIKSGNLSGAGGSRIFVLN
jgi:hypothetical protein